MRQVVLIVVISSRGKQFRQNRQIRQRVKRAGQEHIAKAERMLKEKIARGQRQTAARMKAEIDTATRDAAAAKRESAAKESAIRYDATKASTVNGQAGFTLALEPGELPGERPPARRHRTAPPQF
jgi:hypothetical protein